MIVDEDSSFFSFQVSRDVEMVVKTLDSSRKAGSVRNLDNCIGKSGKKASHGRLI